MTKRRLLRPAWPRHTSWMGSESKSRGQNLAKRVVHPGVGRWAVRVADVAAMTTAVVVVVVDMEHRRITAGAVAEEEVTVTAAVPPRAMDTAAAALMAPPRMVHTVAAAAADTVVVTQLLPQVGIVTVTPSKEDRDDVLSPPLATQGTVRLLQLAGSSSMPLLGHLRVGMKFAEVPGTLEQPQQQVVLGQAHTAMPHEERRGAQTGTVRTD